MVYRVRLTMSRLHNKCVEHLRKALEKDSNLEKHFHIRQALQYCSIENSVEEIESETPIAGETESASTVVTDD